MLYSMNLQILSVLVQAEQQPDLDASALQMQRM